MLSCKLKEAFGLAPAKGVIYEPEELYALVTKHHNERYGGYITSMRRLRRVFRRCGRGRELLITDGPSDIGGELSDDSSSDEDGMQYPYRGDDKLCMGWRSVRRVLSAYGGGAGLLEPGNNPTAELVARLNDASRDEVQRHVNRHLPPALQQLGGILLRPQGDTQRGYVIPTVVLHYATGMAQMAEMYGEDIGAGDLDEWVCRPGDWGVSGAVGSQMRTLVGRVAAGSESSEDGASLPILAIDANTASTETLELIAAYCAALAAEHVELDGKGLLNTDALPVYPTIAVSTDAPSPADGDGSGYQPPTPIKQVPITTDWVQPFPYLSASMLLPSAYPTEIPNLAKPSTQLRDVYLAVRDTHSIGHDRRSENGKAFINGNGYGGLFRNVRLDQRLGFSQDKIENVVDRNPFHVTPLEALFALEHLLPQDAHGRCLGATTPHQKRAHDSTIYPSFEAATEMFNIGNMAYGSMTSCVSASSASDHEFVNACGGVQYAGTVKCGDASDWVCGGRQVEPRLGYLPYKSELVGFPAWNGFTLPTTIDQFLANASARVIAINAALEGPPHEIPKIYNTASIRGPTPDRGIVEACVVLVDPTSTVHPTACGVSSKNGGSGMGLSPQRHIATKPSTSPPRTFGDEEEAVLIRASLARTSDVMKVANFLGLAPLVELCGLVAAILLRGNSLLELRETLRSQV